MRVQNKTKVERDLQRGLTVQLGYPESVMIWGGLYLRDERLRALIPLRRAEQANL